MKFCLFGLVAAFLLNGYANTIFSWEKEISNIDVKILDIKQVDDKNVMIKVSYLSNFAENITQTSKAYEFKPSCNEKYFSGAVKYNVISSSLEAVFKSIAPNTYVQTSTN
ncbi:hypothetical protein, partial [Campylobacter sputorum]